MSLLHHKDVLGHAGSFIPPRWHGEADIDSVYVVKTVAVFRQVDKEISYSELVVLGVGVLYLYD